MNKLKIDEPEPLDEAHEADLGLYYLLTEKARLETHKTKGFVEEEQYQKVHERLNRKINEAEQERGILVQKHGIKLFEQSLHLTAIHIERTVLKQLYINGEVSERVFRQINSKLNLQTEHIEAARHEEIDPSQHRDKKDVFDALAAATTQRLFERRSKVSEVEEKLQYYRAQMIMARKAVKTISGMQHEYAQPVFIEAAYSKVVARYEQFKKNSAEKMDAVLARHNKELAPYLAKLAQRSIRASGGRALDFLRTKGIATESVEHEIEHHYAIRW